MKTHNKMQGGTMNYKTPISLLLSVVAWFAFLSAPAHGAAGEGKFHLIYLVSAEKVEIGAKAYVEPLFFTDGNKLVFAYGYCRQYYKRTGKPAESLSFFGDKDEILTPEQIGDDLTPIHRYCDGQHDVKIDLKNYAVRSNAGTALKLNTAAFAKLPLNPMYPPGPMFPKRGPANIVSVQGQVPRAPEFKLADKPQYFFLMTANKALLDRIAPVRSIAEGDKARLDQRWEQYRKDRLAGKRTIPHAGECAVFYPSSNNKQLDQQNMTRHGNYHTVQAPQILDVNYTDIDKDGKPDLLARMLETYKVVTEKHTSIFSEAVIRVFYGNGKEQCVLRNESDSTSRHPADGPVYFVRVGACSYVGMSLRTHSEGVDLFSLPAESSNCKNRRAIKYDTRG